MAIWPDFDPEAGSFDIFIGGLSGETFVVDLPKPVTITETEADGTVKQVKKTTLELSKTLRISYTVPGEASARIRVKAKMVSTAWIMR